MKGNEIEVSRIHKIEGDSKLKAFVDLSLDGVIIKGLRIVSGSSGLFVGMPRHQGKDGKWYNTVYPATKEIQERISNLVLAAYEG
ncbi:MAG: septation protein spoVG [Candidatus Omnitrophica bacterium]|nr:septation protein spoVG [Candidatus Omnitrophota bacterium]